MRTRVYVDGFNLFYGALSGRSHKWLDLYSLFQDHVLDKDTVVDQVFYYTADIKAAAADDPTAAHRQKKYLRALEQYRPGLVTIRKGFIQRSTPYLRTAQALPGIPAGTAVQVFKFSEKKSDVQLASDLISDAWKGLVDQVVLCSNDSDLAGALEMVRRDLPQIRVGVVAPLPEPVTPGTERQISADLKRHSHWSKRLSAAHLSAAQLPPKIPGTPLTRPAEWT